MQLTLTPCPLGGTVQIPPSKSYSHRAVICASLAGGGSLTNVGDSADIRATRACMDALARGEAMDAGESGSTLRFLIPIALARCGAVEIGGSDRLMERPLDDYTKILEEQSIFWERKTVNGRATFCARGELHSGTFRLRGDVSSQFISGLLFALPLLTGDSRIVLTTAQESTPYVDMTIDVLRAFGVAVERTADGYAVRGGQSYRAADYAVESDYSQAAFFLAMGAECRGLNANSLQGDRVIVELFREMGMTITKTEHGFVSDGRTTRAITADVRQCPDLVPVLAAKMAVTEGESRIVNGARLRMKECDRLQAMAQELTRLGADVTEGADSLTIRGKARLLGGHCGSHNDHRVAMALAAITPHLSGDLVLDGAESVEKSLPHFWDLFQSIGGMAR